MWTHVTSLGKNGDSNIERSKCSLVGGGSVARIKAHLSSLKGEGVKDSAIRAFESNIGIGEKCRF